MKISSIFKYELFSDDEIQHLKSFSKENGLKFFIEYDFQKDKIFVYIYMNKLIYKVHKKDSNSRWFIDIKRDFPMDYIKTEEEYEIYKLERSIDNFLVINIENEENLTSELSKIEEIEQLMRNENKNAKSKIQNENHNHENEQTEKPKRRKKQSAKEKLLSEENEEKPKRRRGRRKKS